MIVIGVDFHPELQQIALVDTDSGELEERRPPALGCHRQFLELNRGLQREIGIGYLATRTAHRIPTEIARELWL